MRYVHMVVLVVITAITACDDPLTANHLAGSYEASLFTVVEGSSTEDLLAQGASIDLTLNANGSTSGRLFVPGGNEDGSDLDTALDGKWTLDGSQVFFDHPADTFIRDMIFTASAGRLVGHATFDGVVLDVVLDRR